MNWPEFVIAAVILISTPAPFFMFKVAKVRHKIAMFGLRATQQNDAYLSGDPTGFYGDYPPAMGPFTPPPPQTYKCRSTSPGYTCHNEVNGPNKACAQCVRRDLAAQKKQAAHDKDMAKNDELARKAIERKRKKDVWTCSQCGGINHGSVILGCLNCTNAATRKRAEQGKPPPLPAPRTPRTKSICWNCEKPHDGPPGRCPDCAAQFKVHRGTKPITSPAPATNTLGDCPDCHRHFDMPVQPRCPQCQARKDKNHDQWVARGNMAKARPTGLNPPWHTVDTSIYYHAMPCKICGLSKCNHAPKYTLDEQRALLLDMHGMMTGGTAKDIYTQAQQLKHLPNDPKADPPDEALYL